MACAVRRLLHRCALPCGCALAALWASPAAASDLRLFTADTLELSGDLRLVAVDGERSWLEHGFGKLRSGSDGDFRIRPQLGNASLVWQPQLTWALSGTFVGSLQGGERTQAGLSQAYLNFRPLRSASGTAFSARAGLMWPPVSLEHSGADWHVADTITPSAINSWIGEEVRPVALEGTVSISAGDHKLRTTAAIFAANDTSGTLLTFRGWALHDRTTLAFNRWPLPPIDGEMGTMQAPFTHPLIDLHKGFAHRPGYYAKLAWQPPLPVRVELFRYDNRAGPTDVNDDMEWGWRTTFENLGLAANLGGGAELKAQALQGRTRMGYAMDGRRWVDNRFRSAFVLASKPLGPFGIAARAEAFDTRNRGSLIAEDYDETGWSAMVVARREWEHFTGLVELLHVSSRREDREDPGLAPRQRQTELQAEVRMDW
ncbi:hypothetical protein [Sphingomonas segetis]|jgi:hypothetical protein|uniref:hypothetical protein n=1 Tax=Sphingomonas segetis TaxID=1104779 RepID=UPI0012D34129|nr:hypothetical protein [Sphingomonas segetis]